MIKFLIYKNIFLSDNILFNIISFSLSQLVFFSSHHRHTKISRKLACTIVYTQRREELNYTEQDWSCSLILYHPLAGPFYSHESEHIPSGGHKVIYCHWLTDDPRRFFNRKKFQYKPWKQNHRAQTSLQFI